MKQTSKMLVVIAVLLSTVTSQAKHVIPAKGTKQFQNTNTESVGIKSMGEAQKEDQLTSVFDTYFSVKDALVSSNGNDAAGKAKQMLLAIKSVKMEKLDMKVHMVWMKVVKDLTEDAEHISETKDPKHQRDHFITLSKNVYQLMKVSKQAAPVYIQRCPMANGGKGADWLSKESAVKNPYYGSMMLTCGKVVETIK